MMRDIILNVLYNLGGRREVDRYVREYAAPDRTLSAVVKVGGALIESDLDGLGSSLAFLRHVGMAPIVVHGGGPQLTRELESMGLETEWVDGLRVTTPEVFSAARRVFHREGSRLAGAIDAHGARARLITDGVFEVEPLDEDRFGLVGRVVRVDLRPIDDAIASGYLPILSPLGTTRGGQLLNINADTATRAIATAVRPAKLIFLTGTGGILDKDGGIISAINLEAEREALLDSGMITGGMARKLIEIDETLGSLPVHASVSITSPRGVAKELFTDAGSGTLVRRGVEVGIHRGIDGLDRPALRALLERSFSRRLADGYLDGLDDAELILAPYTAVAIIRTLDGYAYLDKFGVTSEAQGGGVGTTIWKTLVERHPSLVWRSRSDNPINGWYMQNADGMERREPWLVFWRGLDDRRSLGRAIERAASLPPTLDAEVVTRSGMPRKAVGVEH